MIPLFSVEQNRNADIYAIEKLQIPGIVLMENASRSIIEAFFNNFPEVNICDEIGIICGKGNNGGDGFAVARQLVNRGFKVNVLSIPERNGIKGDALINYNILSRLVKYNSNLKIKHFKSPKDLSVLAKCSVIFDALLGTGTKGELKEPYSLIINKLNSFNAIKIAIDLPSGLDVHNSTGSVIFNADLTVTLGEVKTGLFYGKGYENAGKIEKGSIGIGEEYFDGLQVNNYLIEPEDALQGLPEKTKSIHKYSAGKALVIAGSGSFPGAAALTANSCLKAGAGAVVLAFPNSIKQIIYHKITSATVSNYDDSGTEMLSKKNIEELKPKIEWADVVAVGPGIGRSPETVQAVKFLIQKYPSKTFVLDADAVFALNSVYNKINLRNNVLTPHHKEFAGLIGVSLQELEQNILKLGKKFSMSTKAYLVLKGAPTILFNPRGEVFINSTGNAGMAKFGMGDVLTGIIASLIAQNKIIEDSIISSVYLHSLTADLLLDKLTEFSINAEDIIINLPESIKFLRRSIVRNT